MEGCSSSKWWLEKKSTYMNHNLPGAGVALPARQRRVKVICDLARLASEVYCIIIIINIANLINCYGFHFSFQYVIKRGFLEIRCRYSVHVHRDTHG